MRTQEFDKFAQDYDALLQDPLRDRFMGTEAEFFHVRKRDLIRRFARTWSRPVRDLHYLDVGCGRGELLKLLAQDFGRAAGCDPSTEMLGTLTGSGVETRPQSDPEALPFASASFDFVTAVCVYHHVPPAARAALTQEITRVLRPGGVFCMIEHNPYNPVTRAIVSRTPVDADAILLTPRESRNLMRGAKLRVDRQDFFLFLPAGIYRRIGAIENLLAKVPLGGQYATCSTRP